MQRPIPKSEFLTYAHGLISEADRWRDSAEKVLYWAGLSLVKPGVTPYNDRALALVERCFKIKDPWWSTPQDDIANIKKVFRNIAAFFAAAKSNKGYVVLGPQVSGKGTNRPDEDPAAAYASVGGWKRREGVGITFVYEECQLKGDEELIDIIVHESVHFAGGINHFLIDGKTPAYGEKAFGLSNSQALKNASSYAYLAYLARKPSEDWATAT